MSASNAPRLVHTPRHIAGRALLAAISGRLWYHRLSTPVLEQLRAAALQAAHGRKDTDPVLLAALRALREADGALTRRARLDQEEAEERAALAARQDSRDDIGGGARVPLPPPPPGPLAPARMQPEPADTL